MQTSTTSNISTTLSHQTESDTTFHYSSDFLEWLRTEEISLALSTYQTNKLFLIGRDTTKHLFVSERSFERAMGLHVESENSFYLSTRFLLWRFENALAAGQIHKEADKVYIPRQAFNTGDLNVHDVSVDKNGEIVFVNTRYNCIAKISEKYNFKPLWMPPFITKMVSEDRCHLNGMAMRDGKPRYVTMVSQTDRLDAWREFRHNGGIVMDMETSEVLAEGLSMPHSPRYYQDKLWVLNAGKGEFGYIDSETNTFKAIAQLDGFLRGLAFHQNYAIIGLSKPRHERTFTGLPLENILNERQAEPKCGIWIVDINTGEVVHSLESEGEIVELYDIQVLPNTKRPFTIDLKTDDITRFIAIEGDDDTVDFKALASLDEDKNKFTSPYSREEKKENPSYKNQRLENSTSNHIDPNLSATSKKAIKYQVAANMTAGQLIQQFNNYTFPRLDQLAKARRINEPLMLVVARNHQQYIGAIIIEAKTNGTASIISWYVLPPYRGLGVGKNLLLHAEKILKKSNFQSVNLNFRSDWANYDATKHLLSYFKWENPITKVYICKASHETILNAPWLNMAKVPKGMKIFLWKDLTPQEENEILEKKRSQNWFGDNVTPFQNDEVKDLTTSVGFRYNGQVAGWMITHRTKPDTVEFTAAFVDPELQRQGYFLPILAEAIKYSVNGGAKYGIWQMEANNSSIHQFVEKFLKPYLITFTELKFSFKILQ
ncbi:MAG: TIGR03032 family protein [Flexibacter sp. CG_4_10_14_3_um_filter_32_15]|nr:MAG: TIGR03032 family protein [Flexibacter sp. CG_4_10_14_3_um_filter_32_15]